MRWADTQAVEEIKREGIESIDVVIANAAVNLGCGVGFKDIDVELQEETFRINVSHHLLERPPRTRVEKLMPGPWPSTFVPSYSWYAR